MTHLRNNSLISTLHVRAGMSNKQIALVLGSTVDAVESIAKPLRERAESDKRSDAGKCAAHTRIMKKRDEEKEERRDVTEKVKAKLSTMRTDNAKSRGKQSPA